MKRAPLNLLVDALAAGFLVGMLATGYVIRYPLPRGTHSFLRLWGMDRHQWGEIHFWLSMGLLVVLIVHLVLHWQWVVSMLKRHVGGDASPAKHLVRAGLATVLVIAGGLSLFAWIAQNSVVSLDLPREQTPRAPEDKNSFPASDLPAEKEVSFWLQVYPVLERACLSCHGPRKQRAGFRVDVRDDYLGKNGRSPLVLPGNSAASPLIAIVSGARPDMAMADQHRLSTEEIALLRTWIDAGAPWPEGRK